MHALELVPGQRHSVLYDRRHYPDRGRAPLQAVGHHHAGLPGAVVDHHRRDCVHQQPSTQHGRSAGAVRQDLRQALDPPGALPDRHGRGLDPVPHELQDPSAQADGGHRLVPGHAQSLRARLWAV